MSVHVPAAVRRLVRERAGDRCEYCRVAAWADRETLQFDHVRPLQHLGRTDAANLCLACAHCNQARGPNMSGFDPGDDSLVALFNPRADRWDEHFRAIRGLIFGLTPAGRASVRLLRMNAAERIFFRTLSPPAGSPD